MSDDQAPLEPPTPVPPPEPSRKPMSRGLIAAIVVGVLAIGIVAGLVIGGGGGDGDETTTSDDEEAAAPSRDDEDEEDEEATTTTRETTTTERPTTTEAPTTTTTLPGVDDGTHLVPAEIAPGRWMTPGGTQCFYARLSGLGGTVDQQITGTISGGGPAIIDIAPTDAAFDTAGCERWVPYETPVRPVTTFGPGDYAVRGQIVPGTYRADGVTDECNWERARGFGHDIDELIDFGDPIQQATVVIANTDNRFSSTGCGTWTKVA